jgi:hypothetical protein
MTEQIENGRFTWVAGALGRSARLSARQLDREHREGIPSARSGARGFSLTQRRSAIPGACMLHPSRARACRSVGRAGGWLGQLTDWLIQVMYSVCMYVAVERYKF